MAVPMIDRITLLERMAPIELGKSKPTGKVELIINQGGIQNRNIPKEMKQLFKEQWRNSRNLQRTERLIYHVAEGRFRTFNFKWKQAAIKVN